MADTSPNLNLPYLLASQADKHVTLNEALSILDRLVHLTVVSASVTAQPATPTTGQAYIIPTNATGVDWTGFSADQIAIWEDGAWLALTARTGWLAWVQDQSTHWVREDQAWKALSSPFTRAPTDLQGAGFVVRRANGTSQARGLQAGQGMSVVNPRGENGDPTLSVNQADAFFWSGTHKFTAPTEAHVILTLAQIGSIAWFGDINGAKWSTKLGGYKLSFASDSDVFQTALDNDSFTQSGRTFRVKARIDTQGVFETLSGYRVAGTMTTDALGCPCLPTRLKTNLPPAGQVGRLIAVTDGAANKRLAISDGTIWRWPDGTAV
jgi:hypothetical protein